MPTMPYIYQENKHIKGTGQDMGSLHHLKLSLTKW